MSIYTCYREHHTEIPDEENPEGLCVSCPAIEEVKTHYRYGKVCGRLAFKNLDRPIIGQKEENV